MLGVVGGAGVIFGCEYLGQIIYPLPEGLDPNDYKAMKAAMATIPAGALVVVLLGWAAGSLAGGWVAARIATRAKLAHAMTAGFFLMAAAILNMILLPHPLWFWLLGVGVFLPAAYLGGRLAGSHGAVA